MSRRWRRPPASPNQFLVLGDEPLIFHTGLRHHFSSVRGSRGQDRGTRAATTAPAAEVAHGQTSCLVSLNDTADRPPRVLADGEVIDLGGKRVRYLDTPHLPHGWEAGLLYEEATGTLLCGDLFAHVGGCPPLTTGDLLGPAIAAEEMFKASCLTPVTGPTIRRLAVLGPKTLAVMQGSSFMGDGGAALKALADYDDARGPNSTRMIWPACAPTAPF